MIKKKKKSFINKFSIALGLFFALFGFISAFVCTHALPYNQEFNSRIISTDYVPYYFGAQSRRVDYVTTDILDYDLFQVVVPLNYFISGAYEDTGVVADIEIYCFPTNSPRRGDLSHDSQYYQGTIQLDCDANGDNMYTQVVFAVQVDHEYFNRTGYDFVLYVPNNNQIYFVEGDLTYNKGTQIYVDYSVASFIQGVYLDGYNNGLAEGIAQADEDVQRAYSQGVYTGYQQGYKQGDKDGFDRGVASVPISQYINQGFSEGVSSVDTQYYYNIGYNNGFDAGQIISSDGAYKAGYLAGKAEGRAEVPADSTLNAKDLLWTIGSTPFETFKQVFNFDILGVNISAFILGLITVFIIIRIIKLFI